MKYDITEVLKLLDSNKMSREQVLKNTIEKLHQLDEGNLKEAKDFVDFLLLKVADRELQSEIQKQAEKGKSFDFLRDEEELYSLEDLKDIYDKPNVEASPRKKRS